MIKKTLLDANPDIAAEWHPTKNGSLTPEYVPFRSHKKVWWKCKKGHEWEAYISNRTRWDGCPYCVGRLPIVGETDLLTTHPQLAAEWHPTKNGFGPDTVSAGSHKKVWWICSRGHEWNTTVNSRTATPLGCPYCANKKLLKGFNDFATRYPEIAKEWHPTKNAPLLPSAFILTQHKAWWICSSCGHEWLAYIKNRAKGSGCPACANKRKGRNTQLMEKCK